MNLFKSHANSGFNMVHVLPTAAKARKPCNAVANFYKRFPFFVVIKTKSKIKLGKVAKGAPLNIANFKLV